VSAGVDGTLYLTEEGRVFGAGNNSNNQLGLNKAGGLCGPIRAKAMKARMINAVEEGAELVRKCCEPGGRISLDTSGNPRQRASQFLTSDSPASYLALLQAFLHAHRCPPLSTVSLYSHNLIVGIRAGLCQRSVTANTVVHLETTPHHLCSRALRINTLCRGRRCGTTASVVSSVCCAPRGGCDDGIERIPLSRMLLCQHYSCF